MTATLNTRGYRLPAGVVRAVGAVMAGALAVAVALQSRPGTLIALASLVVFAGWVGMSQTNYEVSAEQLRFSGVFRSTTLQRDEIRTVMCERDELNIEELTIVGDQGKSIAFSRTDLVDHPHFAEQLRLLLTGPATADERPTSVDAWLSDLAAKSDRQLAFA